MIQRKQSLWLLISSLVSVCILFFDVYRGEIMIAGAVTQKVLRVANHYPSLISAVVMIVLPLLTIFMFRDRKRQIRMCIMCIVSTGSFIAMMLARVTGLEREVPPVTNGSYWVGAVLPVLSLIFLILAIIGIRKDENLVRSADRLR